MKKLIKVKKVSVHDKLAALQFTVDKLVDRVYKLEEVGKLDRLEHVQVQSALTQTAQVHRAVEYLGTRIKEIYES